jgi:transcriptional regulator with XRE-family HTH domain
MEYRVDYSIASSEQIVEALGQQVQQIRLSRNMTQAQIAQEAGISVRTVRNFEHGESTSLLTFVRLLSALGIQGNLSLLLPDPTVRPVDRIEAEEKRRQRARPTAKPPGGSGWSWGDEDSGQ